MARTSEYERTQTPYPLVRLVHRKLEASYEGPAYVWDIDKTYLDTRFSQARHLLKIPFEFGVDKRAISGTVELLHALREGPGEPAHRPLYFVSASPPQLRRSLEKKMLLDGVEYDGLHYKDWGKLLGRGEFDQIREQVGYKLSALLVLYKSLPAGARLYLFGDDAEKDALAYCLFADVAAGRLRGRALHDSLVVLGARHRYASAIASFSEALPEREAVAEVLIHLIGAPDGQRISKFGPHVCGYATATAAARRFEKAGLLSTRHADEIEKIASPSQLVFGQAPADRLGLWTPREFLVL